MAFTEKERIRYSRHVMLDEIGFDGQALLKKSRVLCVGAGGLGCAVLPYLSAAGVGILGIVDNDVVELSNLHRQVLYDTKDVNCLKTAVAQKKLIDQNPHLNVISHSVRLDQRNILEIFSQYDIVVDCSDNFPTRYLVNDACFSLQKPNVFASISQFEGLCTVFCVDKGPCYRCLYPEPPPAGLIQNCGEAGVLGVVPGFLGVMQANEVLKLILTIGQSLVGRMLSVNMLSMQFNEFKLSSHKDCLLCSQHIPFEQLPRHDENACLREAENTIKHISPEELKSLKIKENVFVLDVRQDHEYAICNIGGYLIPLNELSNRLSEINRDQFIIVHCKTGTRSLKAAEMLLEKGFSNVAILRGGIVAWKEKIDSSLNEY